MIAWGDFFSVFHFDVAQGLLRRPPAEPFLGVGSCPFDLLFGTAGRTTHNRNTL
jgi:hypothetical protein